MLTLFIINRPSCSLYCLVFHNRSSTTTLSYSIVVVIMANLWFKTSLGTQQQFQDSAAHRHRTCRPRDKAPGVWDPTGTARHIWWEPQSPCVDIWETGVPGGPACRSRPQPDSSAHSPVRAGERRHSGSTGSVKTVLLEISELVELKFPPPPPPFFNPP